MIKRNGLEVKIDPLNHKKKLIEIRVFKKAHSIKDLFRFW